MVIALAAAILLLEAWPSIAGDPASAYFQAGLEMASRQDLESAIGQFEMAVLLRPTFAEAWFNLGAVLHNKGDFEGGRKAPSRKIWR